MLLLIQRGGCISYFGPLGAHSSDLIEYLCHIPGGGGVLRKKSGKLYQVVRASIGGEEHLEHGHMHLAFAPQSLVLVT